MQKIYYDITHLVGWKGGLTGIPRTTDEIARRLMKHKNVVFVSWDVANCKFVKIDIVDYYTNVDPANRSYFKESESKQPNPADNSVSFSMKSLIIRTPVLGKASKRAHIALKKARGVASRARSKDLRTEISLNKDDTFFIPCGVWDDRAYITTLINYKKKGVKLAFISYDMLPIVVPQFSGQWGKPMEDFTEKITANCDVVFSISEYTKNDLIQWLEKRKHRIPTIDVIRLGDAYQLSSPKPPHQKIFPSELINKEDEFVLCVGTVEARKNHTLLYYTYKLAKSRGVKLPRLVIAGRPGHRTENIIGIINDDPDVNSDIVMLFNADDHELSWLYQNCRFTVYPSFYEGWGLPIAESVANGIPCICSNTSSMTEVAPGYVEYFNPNSPDECLDRLIYLLDQKNLRTSKKRLEKYEPISWDFTYNQICKSFEKKGIILE